MVQRYEVRGTELGGDAFYEDWVEVVRQEDYAKLEVAVITLLADINRRYPGEGFKCPLILKLAEIVEHEPRN